MLNHMVPTVCIFKMSAHPGYGYVDSFASHCNTYSRLNVRLIDIKDHSQHHCNWRPRCTTCLIRPQRFIEWSKVLATPEQPLSILSFRCRAIRKRGPVPVIFDYANSLFSPVPRMKVTNSCLVSLSPACKVTGQLRNFHYIIARYNNSYRHGAVSGRT